jgi:hypothetical protein
LKYSVELETVTSTECPWPGATTKVLPLTEATVPCTEGSTMATCRATGLAGVVDVFDVGGGPLGLTTSTLTCSPTATPVGVRSVPGSR